MFTPPPSPLPIRNNYERHPSPLSSSSSQEDFSTLQVPDYFALPKTTITTEKRSTARRTRLTVLLVPVVLILIALSTRFLAHPASFDAFAEPRPESWHSFLDRATDFSIHKRHSASSDLEARANVLVTSETLPTVPTDPTLPSPFPQPYDSDYAQNFSTASCSNFFLNMTNTPAFRSCRPFSLLLQSSSDFINAQLNLTLLNDLIWGTCNTSVDEETCDDNMAWFINHIKTDCSQEISEQQSQVVNTLTALSAFSMMRPLACLSDPTTNAYCFVTAAFNSNPSDLYFYSLPLGTPLPSSTTPTCSSCTKSLMTQYAAALQGTSSGSHLLGPQVLTGLSKTYANAVALTGNTCGSSYAPVVPTSLSANTSTNGAQAVVPKQAFIGSLTILALALGSAGALLL